MELPLELPRMPSKTKQFKTRITTRSEKGVRIKRLLEANVSDIKTLHRLEQNSLYALREFQGGRLLLEKTFVKFV